MEALSKEVYMGVEKTHIELIRELGDKVRELEEILYGREHPKETGLISDFDAMNGDYKFSKRVFKTVSVIFTAVILGGIGTIWWLIQKLIEHKLLGG